MFGNRPARIAKSDKVEEHDVSKVEVRQRSDGERGVFALQDIAKDDVVYVEYNTLSWVFEMGNPTALSDLERGEPVTLTAMLLEDPEMYQSFLDTGVRIEPGNWKPIPEDKRYLQELAKKYKVPYKKVIEVWSVVCLYNVRGEVMNHDGPNFPTISINYVTNFANHSCSANGQLFNAVHEGVSMSTMIATEEIKAGDEITYSYVLPDTLEKPVKERRKELMFINKFKCSCPRCTEELAELSSANEM